MKLKQYLIPLLFGVTLYGQNLAEFQKRITEFTLANGMHFIVLERHEAPVVSFHTYVNAGSVDDPKGRSGLAHMFEHMAFKGTETIGTTNWTAERKAMDDIERAYDQLEAERNKLAKADPAKAQKLEADVRGAIEKADTFVVPNLYPRIIEENGGVGMNAGTSEDSTDYFYNFPANRVELWFYLESARFLHPVYREFYKERDVVREERRMRVESDPQGKMMEQMLATAIEAHPYRIMPGGWASDIENLRVKDAEKFFATYYVPANITMAVVGDVNPSRIKALAEEYFGRMQKRPLPNPVITIEPQQEGPKHVDVTSPAQPMEFVAYHRPSQYDKDDPVFDVISSLLSGGRTSIMYRDMVSEKRLALEAGAESQFPGGKYPGLFFFYLVPGPDHTAAENEKELDAVIANLQEVKVDEASLARVKTRTRAGLIRQLDDNAGLAQLLSSYYANFGDWKKLFTSLDEIDHVTADDVQRVARQYFTNENRTVAVIVEPRAQAREGAK
ncbi:MAG TPA: pitrilysin family protein [Bryobacteraceae bacterium]|jgi:predicted Zn-dependent peptidase|nr:pitrilysin family protein [Bryobacteraceae bacterium]